MLALCRIAAREISSYSMHAVRPVLVPLRACVSSAPRRGIASGTTNGIAWFNASVHSLVRPIATGDAWVLHPLGTSSSQPTRVRNVSCTLLRADRWTYMIDCGEGAAARLRDSFLTHATAVHRIFITHMHGDHVFGLPSVLAQILDADRQGRQAAGGTGQTGPDNLELTVGGATRLEVYGPVGLHAFLTAAFCTLPRRVLRRFPIDVFELLPGDSWRNSRTHMPPQSHSLEEANTHGIGTLRYLHPDRAGVYTCVSDDTHAVQAAPLTHTVPCYGYVVQEAHHMHIVPERVLARGVRPGPVFKQLKAGQPIRAPDGSWIRPEDVMEAGARGRKLVVLGDNCDATAIAPLSQGADVVLHEATIHDGDEEKAKARGHATAAMAGRFAASVNASRLVLTHFSPGFQTQLADACIHQFGSAEVYAAELAHRGAMARRNGGSIGDSRNGMKPRYPRVTERPRPASRGASSQADASTESVTASPQATVAEGAQSTLWHAVLETHRANLVEERFFSSPTTVQQNVADAIRSQQHAARRLIYVDKFAHPEVAETVGMTSQVEAAQRAFGRSEVVCARDFMAIPLARERWRGRVYANKSADAKHDLDPLS